VGLRVKQDPETGIWQIKGTVSGVRIRESARTRDKRLAEEKAAEIEAEVYREGQRRHHHTFEQAVIAYVEDGGEARFLAPALDYFAGWELRHITPAAIRKAASDIYPGTSASTRNRQGIVPVQAVVNHAHQQGWCPPIRVKRFPERKPERRVVGREWIDALMAHAAPNTAALALFMFQTGARIGEAVELGWADVDLGAMTAILRETKNGEDHTVHLTAELAAAMAALPLGSRVFGYAAKSGVYGALRRACKRAGIDYVPPHQAGRHSFATALREEGMGAEAIAKAGNWKSVPLVSSTYIHPTESGRKAAEIMGRLARNRQGGQS
jgi:integrase